MLILRWDADYHDYANGLDVFVEADSVTGTAPPHPASGNADGVATDADPLGVVSECL